MELPKVYFGDVDAEEVDWRSRFADEPDDEDDDELDETTNPDIVELLGYDPRELEEEEKAGLPAPPPSTTFTE